jgi:hypothetical protein
MTVRVVQVGDHPPEFSRAPVAADSLFAFEMAKAQWTVAEFSVLASKYRYAINKIEAAIEFSSLASLTSAALDFDDIIKGTIYNRETLENIIAKARSAR